jgi:RNA recognition motif-containing protein
MRKPCLLGSFVCPFLIDPESNQRVEKICRKENLVGKKLHVGNLTYSATSSDLQGWFTPFGTVQSAQVISDRETGRSKGFGFVEMDTDAQAQAAIQGLHDQDHDGRRLTVDEAKPRVARTSGFAGGRIDGSGRNGGGNGYGGDGRQH